MNEAERQFAADRETRRAARSVFDARLAQVKADLAARSVGARVADKAKGDAAAVAQEALAVVKDSKGIVAATVGALALWFLRAPIIAGLSSLFDKGEQGEPTEKDEDSD